MKSRAGVTHVLLATMFVSLLWTLEQSSADKPSLKAPPTTFQECVEQGGVVDKAQPAVCVFKQTLRFVQSQQQPPRACADRCGDGTCQEIVCMAVGCPCAETSQSCPKDCND